MRRVAYATPHPRLHPAIISLAGAGGDQILRWKLDRIDEEDKGKEKEEKKGKGKEKGNGNGKQVEGQGEGTERGPRNLI